MNNMNANKWTLAGVEGTSVGAPGSWRLFNIPIGRYLSSFTLRSHCSVMCRRCDNYCLLPSFLHRCYVVESYSTQLVKFGGHFICSSSFFNCSRNCIPRNRYFSRGFVSFVFYLGMERNFSRKSEAPNRDLPKAFEFVKP